MIFKTDVHLDDNHQSEKEVSARQVIDDESRRVLEISIRAGGILKRHKANEPITVLCTKGKGRFYAGSDLEESVEITRGSLVALDPGIDHEVSAESDLRILVTRFK
jgi:quercetin dioxygenase-like cupin family protein